MTLRISGRALSLGLTLALGFAITSGCGGSQEVASPPAKASSGIPERVAVGLADCARGGAARLQPASYEVHFNVHVVPGGEARRVEVASSTLGDRDMEECMMGAFRSVTWKAPAGARWSGGAEAGDTVAPHARGLIAQGIPMPMGPAIAGPYMLFLRLMAGGGGVIIAEGAATGAAAAGEAAAAEGAVAGGAAAVAGGAVIAGIGAFALVFFYPSSIALDPPIASATSMPTTTAVPLPTAIPLTRRYPTQTCDDDELDRLEEEKDKLCKPKGGYAASCNRKKVDVTLIRCSAILLGIQQRKICKARRQFIQDKCFGGKPDAGHQTAIDQEQNGIDQCEALELINCAKGHPMAGL